MHRKKILIVTDNVPTQINGVVTTFKNMENHAHSNGFDIVYCDPRKFYHFDCPGYSEIKISFPFQIGKHIQKENPDYIHIATEGPIGLAARIWLDKKKWRYNTSYHTNIPEAVKKIYGIPEKLTYRYIRWFHKHSGKVLTTTNSMVSTLKRFGFKGEIISWTRGVDREIFNSSLRNPDKKLVLLSVGRISKEKNVEEFCRLNYPQAIKIVVGDGPQKKYLEEKYPEIRFVGYKTGIDLAEYYANADVFVFTSMWDTFGIVMIEAMACGTPVAAFPVTGPIDVVEDGVTGYLDANLDLAIQQCLKLNRKQVEESSKTWSWEECWKIFARNLVEIDLTTKKK
jgi:glycosyltransferase involved in cell wall biosynthesis